MMGRTVNIGCQDFETIRRGNYFYIDKTSFIREWWNQGDTVTLITRPRRFGKTLNMSMVEQFFSVGYAGRKDLFERLSIWEDESFHSLQGAWPVITLSFAQIKNSDYYTARRKICQLIASVYDRCDFLLESDCLNEREQATFCRKTIDMDDVDAELALSQLSEYLSRYYGKKVIILLDEYDTPMQEAYVHGYWEEMSGFMRNLFNASFKTNPYMERALMTGITRVSRESIFSDFNNPRIVTATTEQYEDSFGFTEEEVFAALDEYGLSEKREEVRMWYNGFTFGNRRDIYNPWSIINYLKEQVARAYWANSSANSLPSKLIREGEASVKLDFEHLLQGGSLNIELDEQIAYGELSAKRNSIWSLLLASGYLKVEGRE